MSFWPKDNSIWIGIAAMVIAFCRFSYLHSTGFTDYYRSLPITLKQMFIRRYASGAGIFAVLFIPVCVILYALSMLNRNVVLSLLFFLIVYNITVFAITLTGNWVITLLTAAVMIFYIDLWQRVIDLCCDFATYSPFFASTKPRFSFIDIYLGSAGLNYVWTLIRLLIWAFITFLMCRRSFLNRSAESSEALLTFYSSHLLLKLMIVVPTSLLMGWSTYISFSGHKDAVRIVSMIITAIITSMLIELLFTRKIKAAVTRWGSIIVSLIVIFAVFAVFRISEDKYNAYVPEFDEIESYAVYNPLDSYYYHNNILFGADGSARGYISASDYVKENMYLSDVDAIYRLAKQGIITDYRKMESPLPLQVYYRLTNGKTKSRLVWVDMDNEENRPFLNRIVGPAYYKNGVWQAFTEDIPEGAKVSYVRYHNMTSDEFTDIVDDPDYAKRVVKSWRNAMVSYDYDHIRYEEVAAEIEIGFEGDEIYRWILPVYNDMLEPMIDIKIDL